MIGTPVDEHGVCCRLLPLNRHSFLTQREGGRSSGSAQALSKLSVSVGAQRIHNGLRQQVAPGRRRVNVTG